MPVLTLVSALLHALVAWALLPPLMAGASGLPWAAGLVGAWLAASALLLPRAMRVREAHQGRRGLLMAWAALLAMGAFSSLAVLSLARALGLGLLALGLAPAVPAAWVQGSALAVPVLALLATLAGAVNARRTAAVKAVDVPVAGLPAALHGFTIAQISDLHVGPTIRADQVRAVVERVNALQADLVAITGDLVDGTVADLREHVAPLAALRGRHGRFAVTGNHEYYSGGEAWVAEMRRLGLTVLMNEHVTLRHEGADLVLAGVADWSAHQFVPAHRSDPVRALAGAPAEATRVLLAHQPRSAAAAAEAGFHVQLSGHTHGGQFFPWNFFVRLQQPFTAGLNRVRQLQVYVSRGTGYWGPPKRLGAPSEITYLRLVVA